MGVEGGRGVEDVELVCFLGGLLRWTQEVFPGGGGGAWEVCGGGIPGGSPQST